MNDRERIQVLYVDVQPRITTAIQALQALVEQLETAITIAENDPATLPTAEHALIETYKTKTREYQTVINSLHDLEHSMTIASELAQLEKD